MQTRLTYIYGIAILLWSLSINADQVTHGEMAGAIRSADFPCAHVLEVNQTDDHSWKVNCNAGSYNVSKAADGTYSVTAIEQAEQQSE